MRVEKQLYPEFRAPRSCEGSHYPNNGGMEDELDPDWWSITPKSYFLEPRSLVVCDSSVVHDRVYMHRWVLAQHAFAPSLAATAMMLATAVFAFTPGFQSIAENLVRVLALAIAAISVAALIVSARMVSRRPGTVTYIPVEDPDVVAEQLGTLWESVSAEDMERIRDHLLVMSRRIAGQGWEPTKPSQQLSARVVDYLSQEISESIDDRLAAES